MYDAGGRHNRYAAQARLCCAWVSYTASGRPLRESGLEHVCYALRILYYIGTYGSAQSARRMYWQVAWAYKPSCLSCSTQVAFLISPHSNNLPCGSRFVHVKHTGGTDVVCDGDALLEDA